MQVSAAQPRVLIVDDDPVSLRFLDASVAQCGCAVVTAATTTAALTAGGVFGLLLIDRCLPDIGGVELLHALRARGIDAAAIATSAEIDAATALELRAAGFADVLEKPASVERIGEIVRRHLPCIESARLDDAAALAATGGDADALRALRGLLAKELEQLERDLTHGDLATDAARLDERLHRLRAACGFCGAVALAELAADWQGTMRAGNRFTDKQRAAFVIRCRETGAALRS